MRRSPPPGPHTLSLTLRGPEWAVVLPHGDVDALLDVCRNLSDVWNGSGTLLYPVDEAGESVCRLMVRETILPVDQVLVHHSVGDRAREAVEKRWRAVRWSPSMLQRQVHSWWLARDLEMRDEPLAMPAPATPFEQLLAAVLWGFIDPANMDELRKQYVPVDVPADELLITLLEAQLSGESPLSWGVRHMAPILSVNGPHWRSIYVLPERPEFDDLVCFWNLRARYPSMGGTPLFIGIPVQALSERQRLTVALRGWLARPPTDTKPDLFVDTRDQEIDLVHSGLQAAGLTFVESSAWKTGDIPEDRRRPEYTISQAELPMQLERGQTADMLTNLHEGLNKVRLPIPTDFPTRLSWVGRVTAVVGGLPKLFPMSDMLAHAWWPISTAQGDRLRVDVRTLRDHFDVDLRWPAPQEQLSKHMATAALRAETSQAGRLAQTLIDRLPGRAELDVFALPNALGILETLVARRSKKIAQLVRQELQNRNLADIDERAVAEMLRREGLFAELEVKTLIEMQGGIGIPELAILTTLAPLCEAGHVQRGRGAICPFCETRDFWRLAELDDRLRCRACLQQFPLPAIERGKEPAVAYRLDGLVSRAMGQDIVPVLLTLRYLLNRHQGAGGHWWPGLDLYEGEATRAEQEIDLLYADAGEVWVCEVKRTAGGLTVDQANKLCALAARLKAKPVFSAPIGEWRPEVIELAEREGATLFGASELTDSFESEEITQGQAEAAGAVDDAGPPDQSTAVD